MVSTGDGGVEPYLLCAAPLPGRRPIVAIPTTSGTGAEVTRTCIVADRAGRKSWTWGDEMLPDVVVLDPTAAATMPSRGHGRHRVSTRSSTRSRHAAVNAATRSRRLPHSASLALVLAHLPRVAADGSDLASRQAMQEAAFLAGIAIDNCGTGVAHSIGHALGSLYHVPHGISVAVGLARCAGVERRGRARQLLRCGHRVGLQCRRDRRCLRPAVRRCRARGRNQLARCRHVGRRDRDDDERRREPADAAQQLSRRSATTTGTMLAERTVDVWHGLRP